MSPELIFNLIAVIIFLAAAFSLRKRRDRGNSLIIFGGVVLMIVGMCTLTYAPVHPSPDGTWPTWFRVVTALGPVGLTLLAIAVFRLSTSTERRGGS